MSDSPNSPPRAEADTEDSPLRIGGAANPADLVDDIGDEDILGDEARVDDEEEDGEDLFGDDMDRDYEARPELDQYDPAMLDTDEHGAISMEQRRAAERAMGARDRQERRAKGRLDGDALASSDDEAGSQDDVDGPASTPRPRRKRRRTDDGQTPGSSPGFGSDDGHVAEEDFDLKMEKLDRDQDLDPRMTSKVRLNFRQFLLKFVADREMVPRYRELMQKMAEAFHKHLDVDFRDIQKWSPTLALWIAEYPAKILPILNEALMELAQHQFGTYREIAEKDEKDLRVAVHGFIVHEPICDLTTKHLNKLVCVTGVVTKRTQVKTQLKRLFLRCGRCGFPSGPFDVLEDKELRPGSCAECQAKGPWSVDKERTLYRNFQSINLQESPGKVEPGKMPRSKPVVLSGDLVDTVRPGDELTLTGIYKCIFDVNANARHCFPVYQTQIEAVHTRRKGDLLLMQITDEEVQKIRELARSPNIRERLIHSIAPSIYGMEHVKTAMIMAMFGGQAKVAAGKHRIRGDINVLVVGDPGLAKSQFLKYIEHTAMRAVYTSGKGASAVGLTAAVTRDENGEFTLEGGAMVLADSGICLIDEFDKMNDQDRTSIHEAMEQQTISISKAGIVATLQARCAVIAVANPLDGCYDPSLPFNKNVDLSDPILSRFDVLSVLRDEADSLQDERLADHVVCSHMRSHPLATSEEMQIKPRHAQAAYSEPISQELLKKYITWARENVKPRFAEVDKEKLAQFYKDVRAEAFRTGGAPMTVRHIDGLIRMAEANAKMELRNHVTSNDVDNAIATMLESFVQSQKHAVAEELRIKFRKYVKRGHSEADLVHNLIHRIFHDKEKQEQLRHSGIGEVKEISVDMEEVNRDIERLGISMDDAADYTRSRRFKVDFREARLESVENGKTTIKTVLYRQN